MAQRAPHDVLSDCLERWEQGQGGIEELLAQHSELRDEVEPLLGIAVEVAAMPRLRAPERLRQDPLWRRVPSAPERGAPTPLPLWAAAREDRRARRRAPLALPSVGLGRTLSPRPLVGNLGRIAAGIGGTGLALLLAGSLATSATSLPDEPLYPVKRLVEDAQLAIAPPEARLELRLQRAQERMKETREMIERERVEAVASLAAEYVREVDAVRTELQAPRARTTEPEQVSRVITRLEANEQMLGAVVERVPEPARPAVARAAEASRPESIAPAEVPVQRTVAPPAPAPEAIVPVAAAPEAVAPAAAAPEAVAPALPAAPAASSSAPVFGAPSAPGSIAAPEPASPVQRALDAASRPSGSGPASVAPAPRVSVPSGGAPAILPNPNTSGAPAVSPPASAGSSTSPSSPAAPAAPSSLAAPSSAGPSSATGASPQAPSSLTAPVTGSSGTTTESSPAAPSSVTAPAPLPQLGQPAAPAPASAPPAAPAPSSSRGYTLLPPVGTAPTPTTSATP